MTYEFKNADNAHEFHATAQAHAAEFGPAKWLGVIAGWHPETYRVEVTDAYEVHLLRAKSPILVIDPITDATETATSCTVRPLAGGEESEITDPRVIRALYGHPTAKSYGEGSYTVTL